jgi:hypothetical protein
MSDDHDHVRRAARATRRACAIAAGVVAAALITPLLLGNAYFELDLGLLDSAVLCSLRHQLSEDMGLGVSAHIANGSPLLALHQVQLLYPIRWLALALPEPWATSLSPVFHLVMSAATTAWLARPYPRPHRSRGLRRRRGLAAADVAGRARAARRSHAHPRRAAARHGRRAPPPRR